MIPFYEYRSSKIQVGAGSEMNFPPHLHKDAELIQVKNGQLEVQLDNKKYILGGGDTCMVFPNMVHSYATLTEFAEYNLLIYRAPMRSEIQAVLDKKIPVNPVFRELHEDSIYCIDRLLSGEIYSESPLVTELLFELMWTRLIESIELTQRKSSETGDLCGAVLSYITENFTQKIDIPLLATSFGVTPNKITRIFSGIVRVSFPEYINTMRIDLSKGLLLSGDKSILEIAYSCGFESQQTFNRVFKRLCGMTPREFRSSLVGATRRK